MATTAEFIPDGNGEGEKTDTYVTRLSLNGKTYYSCNFCKRKCRSYAECIGHIRSHTGEKPFSCFYCKKSFSFKSDVKVHERIHTGEKPFSCEVCGLRFLSTSKLIGHRKVKKNIACSSSMSKDKPSNYQHDRTHSGVKQYYCPICNKRYSSESGFRYHLKQSKRSKCVNVILQAGPCPAVTQAQTSPFEASRSQMGHRLCTLNSATNTNVTQEKVDGKVFYFCGFCKKKFKKGSEAVCHVRIHTGVKPFTCMHSNCNKSFSQVSSLHRHKKTHIREKS